MITMLPWIVLSAATAFLLVGGSIALRMWRHPRVPGWKGLVNGPSDSELARSKYDTHAQRDGRLVISEMQLVDAPGLPEEGWDILAGDRVEVHVSAIASMAWPSGTWPMEVWVHVENQIPRPGAATQYYGMVEGMNVAVVFTAAKVWAHQSGEPR